LGGNGNPDLIPTIVSNHDLGSRFVEWAMSEPSVLGLVQIGSRIRAADRVDAADENSDWDYQIITAEPQRFDRSEWAAREARLGAPLAYVCRGGRLGSARKASAVFQNGEMDFV